MSDQSLSKPELWRLRIQDHRNSGMTAPEWCKQNSLSLSALRYWIHKLNKNQIHHDKDFKPVFAELPLINTAPIFGTAPVTIHLGIIRIEIAESCHPELLSNLIGVIKSYA